MTEREKEFFAKAEGMKVYGATSDTSEGFKIPAIVKKAALWLFVIFVAMPAAITALVMALSCIPFPKMSGAGAGTAALVWIFVTFILYFLPFIVANGRGHKNQLAIFVLNLFLGITGIFWIIALVWACTNNVEEKKS